MIGIDAEVYILYEDEILIKSRWKKLTWGTIFVSFHFLFSLMNDLPLLWTELLSFQVEKVWFSYKKTSISFLDLNPSFETVIFRIFPLAIFSILYKAFDENFFHHCLILHSTCSVGNMYNSCNKQKDSALDVVILFNLFLRVHFLYLWKFSLLSPI